MTIQPRLTRNPDDEDRLSATTSTPCLHKDATSFDENNNEGTKVIITDSAEVKTIKSRENRIQKKKSERLLEEPAVNIKNVFGSIVHMPKELARLCLCDLSSWILICTVLIYYTGRSRCCTPI